MFFHVHQCVEEAFSICLLFWGKLKTLTAEVWRGVHVLRSLGGNIMATILGITRNKLINPKQTLLGDLYEIVPDFIGSSDRVKVFKTPFSSSAIQTPPLIVMGDSFHALDTILVLRALEVPVFVQSGFAYDRYTIGSDLYEPWLHYDGPLGLPSFSGGKKFTINGKLVGTGSTNNQDWRSGVVTIARPGPFVHRLADSIRLSGTGCYGCSGKSLVNGISEVTNSYNVADAVPAFRALLRSKAELLFVWLKPTKDFQGKVLTGLYQGICKRLGIRPKQVLETDYSIEFENDISPILDALPDDYWVGITDVGDKLHFQLRDWGLRELDFRLSDGKSSIAYITGDEFGDAFLDLSEGFWKSKAATFAAEDPNISWEDAVAKARRIYGLIPAFGNIGYLIRRDGKSIPNPIDGVDPENWMAQLRGEDTRHTPLAILKMVLAALVQPEARSSIIVHQWADSILAQASAFNGSWDEWVEFLGTLPKFPA